MGRERRRQIVVNKSLQSRIIFAAAWAPGLCLAGTSLLLGVFCARLNNEALQADVALPSILPVFVISVSFMLVATAYMLFNALRFSHRIAGPMYNIGKTLQRFRDGDADSRVILRKHDYLSEMQDHVNGFLEWLSEDLPASYTRVERTEEPKADETAHTAEAQETVAAATVAATDTDTSDAEPQKAGTDS